MAKKIRVEFELDEADVKELIESAPKGMKKLSPAELKILMERGAVRASDFLDPKQIVSLNKLITKLFPFKYVDMFKISRKIQPIQQKVNFGPKIGPSFGPAYKTQATNKATKPKS